MDEDESSLFVATIYEEAYFQQWISTADDDDDELSKLYRNSALNIERKPIKKQLIKFYFNQNIMPDIRGASKLQAYFDKFVNLVQYTIAVGS